MRRLSNFDLPDMNSLPEKRDQIRYSCHGFVPLTLRDSRGEELDLVVLDVSRGGLGILVRQFYEGVGARLDLSLEGQTTIGMIVRWTVYAELMANAAVPGMLRMGLAAADEREDLLQRLEPFGCVDK